MDNSLSRAVAALRGVQAENDPATGLPFDERERRAAREGVRSRVPGKNEGVVALLDGVPTWRPAPETRSVRLEEDPELVEVLAAIPDADTPVRCPGPSTRPSPSTG